MITSCLAALLALQSFWDMGAEKVRAQLNEKFLAVKAETPQVGCVQNITISNGSRNTPLRIYQPVTNTQNRPVILYIHGGAWVAGSLDTHDNLARVLCKGVGAVVISVGYKNAPEGKFPLALEQCYDAFLWCKSHAKTYCADPDLFAVVGDSAGGNLAAALCLYARDRNGPKIDMQVLINPVIDNSWGGTLERKGDKYDDERWVATQYVNEARETLNPYVSPSYEKDLSRLPTTLILLAEEDMFREAAEKYADRLKAAGVPTNSYTQWGVGHLAGNGGRASPLAQESLDVAVASLKGEFRRLSPPTNASSPD